MDISTIAANGLTRAAKEFETAASNTVRDAATPAAGGSRGPLALGGNEVADMVGQAAAMANYRANIAVFKTADAMAKATIDLIG